MVDFLGILIPPENSPTTLYLVTELMHYGSIRDILDKKAENLPLSLRLQIVIDAAGGV